MASLAEAREYLQRVKREVERPIGFYEEYRPAWREQAAQIARVTLQQLRPDSVQPDQWAAAVEQTIETVTAELIDDEYVGVNLWMLRMIEPSKPGVSPYASVITFEALVDWVQAGMNGEEGGKRIRDEPGGVDEGKSARAIAWRVFHALRLNKNPRLFTAIQSWMKTAGPPQVLQALDNVQVAWETFFSVQGPMDFTKWLERVIAE